MAGAVVFSHRGSDALDGFTLLFAGSSLLTVVFLGLVSALKSGTASPALIGSALVNPVGALRTGALVVLRGTTAFGSASLVILRFTGATGETAILISDSLLLRTGIPFTPAVRRLDRADV